MELNLRPAVYKTAALPLSYAGIKMVQDMRIELMFSTWQADVLPLYQFCMVDPQGIEP